MDGFGACAPTMQEYFASLSAHARLRAHERICDRERAGVFVSASAWARPAWMHVRIRPRRRHHHRHVIVVVRGCVGVASAWVHPSRVNARIPSTTTDTCTPTLAANPLPQLFDGSVPSLSATSRVNK